MREVTMMIRVGGKELRAFFHSEVDAIEVYAKMWDALTDADNGDGFELSMKVEPYER